jgi:hypothetical protein
MTQIKLITLYEVRRDNVGHCSSSIGSKLYTYKTARRYAKLLKEHMGVRTILAPFQVNPTGLKIH